MKKYQYSKNGFSKKNQNSKNEISKKYQYSKNGFSKKYLASMGGKARNRPPIQRKERRKDYMKKDWKDYVKEGRAV